MSHLCSKHHLSQFEARLIATFITDGIVWVWVWVRVWVNFSKQNVKSPLLKNWVKTDSIFDLLIFFVEFQSLYFALVYKKIFVSKQRGQKAKNGLSGFLNNQFYDSKSHRTVAVCNLNPLINTLNAKHNG